jgi:hypothetical protein
LKTQFDESGSLIDNRQIKIQKLWEDESHKQMNLKVTEIGLFTFEKQSAF